jgi:hypothetical protein
MLWLFRPGANILSNEALTVFHIHIFMHKIIFYRQNLRRLICLDYERQKAWWITESPANNSIEKERKPAMTNRDSADLPATRSVFGASNV